jgi:calcineurin-like phosphoesterase family protein
MYLNHCPLLCFDGVYRNKPTWQLFGHVHSGPNSQDGLDFPRLEMLFPTQYDVGVDNNNFAPVSFYEIKDIINKRLLTKTN